MRIPGFSQYSGGNQFLFQEKIFNRIALLGSGSFSDVFLFESHDGMQRYAVKCEKPFSREYIHGDDFESEAKWYQTIHGAGVLSGDPKNKLVPHYILMPYFQGELLYLKTYQSVKELFVHWIWTAIAIRHLHQQYHVIHGDLKFDNVVSGSNTVFLIDFGFMTMINKARKNYFRSGDQLYIRHQPPELFLDDEEEKKAHESQDIYGLGYLLGSLFFLFCAEHAFNESEFVETNRKVRYIGNNMMQQKVESRWSIEKSIYMLSVACLSQLPKMIWYHVARLDALDTPQAVFGIAIQTRIDELMAEQKKLTTPSTVKERKIRGLIRLQQNIAEKPACALNFILEAKTDRALTAGIFSNRTEILLCELEDIGRSLRLLH